MVVFGSALPPLSSKVDLPLFLIVPCFLEPVKLHEIHAKESPTRFVVKCNEWLSGAVTKCSVLCLSIVR